MRVRAGPEVPALARRSSGRRRRTTEVRPAPRRAARNAGGWGPANESRSWVGRCHVGPAFARVSFDVLEEQAEGRAFLIAAGLFHGGGELAKIAQDLGN